MKQVLLLLTAFCTVGFSFGQTQVFKEFDFDSGEYSLLAIFSESDKNGLQDSLGEFYTDSIPVLNAFKKTWVFEKPGMHYACGYHYTVYLCKDGIAIQSFDINLNCSEIISDLGCFFFDPDLLRVFKGKLKTFYKVTQEFNSIAEARIYREKILSDAGLIMTPEPEWIKFEGEFDFTYKCPEGKKLCFEKEDSLKMVIKQEIEKAYPGEEFELSDRGLSWTEIDQTLKCNKSLSDKFNLFYREFEFFGYWRPYEPVVTSYRIKK